LTKSLLIRKNSKDFHTALKQTGCLFLLGSIVMKINKNAESLAEEMLGFQEKYVEKLLALRDSIKIRSGYG